MKAVDVASAASAASVRTSRIEWLKLAGVTAAWLLLTIYLAPLGDRYVPDDWKVKISLQTFRMACQLVTLVAGVGMIFAFLRRPRAALGLTIPKGAHLAGAALLSPIAFVASTYIALQIAMPTLLAELATRGPGASRQNAGELGRTLTQAPLLVVLLWGALLAAVGEELLFRGALWSTVKDLVSLVIGPAPQPAASEPGSDASLALGAPGPSEAPDADPPPFMRPSPFAALSRDAVAGALATLASAIIFGQMHADMPGGVGLVRVASTTILGLVCGAGRQLTGTLWVPILLHVLNNTITIGSSRRWFASAGEPILEGLPNPLVIAALAGLCAAAAVLVVLRRARDRSGSVRAVDASGASTDASANAEIER